MQTASGLDRRLTGLVTVLVFLLAAGILAAGPTGLLKEAEVTAEKLQEIFTAAFLKTDRTPAGDLRVAAGPAKVMIKVSEKKKHLYFFAIYGFKDGVPLEKKLAFANKLNNELTLARFSVTEKGSLWCDYAIAYEEGITAYAIVNAVRKVARVIAAGQARGSAARLLKPAATYSARSSTQKRTPSRGGMTHQPRSTKLKDWKERASVADLRFEKDDYKKAATLYAEFIELYGKDLSKDEKAFLRSATRKCALALVFAGKDQEVAGVYDRLLDMELGSFDRSQVRIEAAYARLRQAERMPKGDAREKRLKEMLADVKTLMLLPDLWNTHAPVIAARVYYLQGKQEPAAKLLKMYLPKLNAMHKRTRELYDADGVSLARRLSPLCGARYLMGLHSLKKAEAALAAGDRATAARLLSGKSGALRQFVNVAVNHNRSEYGREALEKYLYTRDILEKQLNAEVAVPPEADVQLEDLLKKRK
jgi:hypothetical protein